MAERVSATVRIASERAQHLDTEPETSSGPDPDALEAQAEEVAAQERQLLDELAESRTRLEAARTELSERESVAAEAERAHMAAARAEADRREGLARLAGQVDTMRTRVESIDETVARLTGGIEDAAAKAQQTQAEFEIVQGRVGELDAGEVGLDDHHDRTVTALRLADERVAELQAAERGAERQVASLRARIEALSVGLDRKDGAAWLQKNHGGPGLFGSIANLVKVRPGYEAAIAAVLGSAADALAAENSGAARSAVAALKESDGGRAAIVLGDWPSARRAQHRPAARRRAVGAGSRRHAPTAARRNHRDAVGRRGGPRPLRRTGHGRGAPATEGGHRRRRPGRRGMGQRRFRPQAKHAGDRVGGREGQRANWQRPRSRQANCRPRWPVHWTEQANRQDAAEQALAALNESDAAISAIYEQLGRLGQDARAADDEWQRLIQQRNELESGRTQTVQELAELEQRLHNAQQEPRFESEPVDRQESMAAAEVARAAEVEARLTVRTAEERANAVRGQADSLRGRLPPSAKPGCVLKRAT